MFGFIYVLGYAEGGPKVPDAWMTMQKTGTLNSTHKFLGELPHNITDIKITEHYIVSSISL